MPVMIYSHARPAARRRYPNYRLAPLFLFALLTAACGGGGGNSGGGPSDTTRPGVQIQDVPNSHDGRTAFTLGIRFSESVSGFVRGDMTVTGAAVTAFSGSGARYTATVRPGGGNAVGIDIAANVARDAAGNGNTAAARQTVAYVAPDTDPPRVTIDAPASHDGRPFEVTFAFSEPVRGFEADDVRVTAGRLAAFPSQALSARYTATLTPNTPPGNIVLEVPANAARDAAGNGNLAASQTVNYSGGEPSAAARISGRLTFDRAPFARTDSSGLNAGSTGHRSHEDCPGGGLDYGNIRREPIRDVWVEAVNASGTVIGRTRSDANGRYNLSVAANTPVRIRVSAHMQRTEADGPRWDVKVTDNTQGNALYVLQGDLTSSGTGASTRNLNAASGWVVPQGGSGGRYANTRAAGPFAILSFTYEALQKFAEADADMNLAALEYRWSPNNRSASGNLADGAIGGPFYDPTQRLIYLRGKADENTDEYDQNVVMHEFSHHVTLTATSRNDSMGGSWGRQSPLDMRVAFSEGFGDALGPMIAGDPIYRDSHGPNQSRVCPVNIETNPSNPATNPHRIGWYHSSSVTAILYDLYDAANDGADRLSLGLAPIYNTLTGEGFKNNRYYTSIYTFANQLLEHVPDRAATQSGLDALLRAHNIFGRGDNGAGETNGGGLPATARVLPVYKSIAAGQAAITLCSVDDTGTYNRLGNRALVEVSFAESGAHTLTMTSASGSTGTLPRFRLRPYRNAAMRTERQLIDEPRSQTVTGNFRAGEAAVLEAYDERNVDGDAGNNGDSCFAFSVVKNP